MARPSKLIPEVHQKIVGLVRAGAFETQAARAAGIDPSTLRRWKERGRGRSGPFREFLEDLERAAGEARVIAEARVFNENPGMWLRLGPGRERPDEPGWTESVKHEHSGPDGGAIPIELIDRLLKEEPDDNA